ncbi:glycosyltransferase [Polynucleobacter sp. MWH-Jannik1A5]|uniref:MraY family glycosyltransferase n=1 Tax=Polynucleobacter sp. MWH-Jannik1A5 TaxID=1855890 RepID=UPI001C0B78E8|nr:glycosyltransferase [Polynucleobacter sp. MWH-Jannik1A5]MBU3546750.1 glycosyltransferase family 4 protein [Polynucleobacter sp. MWH-Jannik1A5]
MFSILIAFFTSFFATILIVRTQKLHKGFSGDHDFDGPQKFHTTAVPRIGGLAIGLALFVSLAVSYQNNEGGNEKMLFLFCALPAFGIGIAEDISKKIGIRTRLIFTAFGALLASILLNAQITSLDIPGLDLVLSISAISIIFTVFAVTGLANAYNIIDGFNGLSSMVGIISLLALAYVGFKFNDPFIFNLSFLMAAAILGFFILNYPRGLIFLGDGGAYLIGFWIGTLSVLLVARHPEISPWFALMVNAYPILETLFTIYRRKFHQGKSPGHPDGLHLHSLFFRRILNQAAIKNELDWFNANSRTAPYLWNMSSLVTIPAIFFYQSTSILICLFILFTLSYIWIYKRMVTFKTPKWLHF